MTHPPTDSVFVALHPFLVISGKSPKRDFGGLYTVLPSGRVIGQAPAGARRNPLAIAFPVPAAESAERLAIGELTKTAGMHVNWEAIRRGCNYATLADIQRALYSIGASLDSPYRNDKSLTSLVDYCDRNSIFFPTDGFIPPSLEKNIGRVLDLMGEPRVSVSDEFEIQNIDVGVADFVAQDSVVLGLPLSIRGTIAATQIKITTPDKGLVCHAIEGAFYTLISIANPQAAAIISSEFDGFWCDIERGETWWIPPIQVSSAE